MKNLFDGDDITRDLYMEMHRKYPNQSDKVDMLWQKVSAYLGGKGNTVYSKTGHIAIEIIYDYEFSQMSY